MFFRKKRTMTEQAKDTAPEATEQVNDMDTPVTEGTTSGAEEGQPYSEAEVLRGELVALKTEHAAIHDKYVRLHAEFDNFRKRTTKERLELFQHAAADTLKQVLPVIDDFERAIANNGNTEDVNALRQGFELIHQKLVNTLAAQGLKRMEAKGQPFDPELHEAIAQVPAPEPALQGKVIDVAENGYMINDKVVRYAKVVVGQ